MAGRHPLRLPPPISRPFGLSNAARCMAGGSSEAVQPLRCALPAVRHLTEEGLMRLLGCGDVMEPEILMQNDVISIDFYRFLRVFCVGNG